MIRLGSDESGFELHCTRCGHRDHAASMESLWPLIQAGAHFHEIDPGEDLHQLPAAHPSLTTRQGRRETTESPPHRDLSRLGRLPVVPLAQRRRKPVATRHSGFLAPTPNQAAKRQLLLNRYNNDIHHPCNKSLTRTSPMNTHSQSRAIILQAAAILPSTSRRKVNDPTISEQDYAAVPPPLNLQVHPAGDCLIWLCSLNADGYGTGSFPDREQLAHRQAFTQSRGRQVVSRQ